MQVLIGVQNVRYLVENARSMQLVHYVAFCKLLGLPYEPHDRYIWDLAHYTQYLSRKWNFFRNFEDSETESEIRNFFDQNCGPLIKADGQVVPFAPLLGSRSDSRFGVCHSSWTLYQPHALVWDYMFWGGKDAFARTARIITARMAPFFCWERIIPPPFLDIWRAFIELIKSKNKQAKELDKVIGPLLPLFNCNVYNLPVRILREEEIMNLSGLGNIGRTRTLLMLRDFQNHWSEICAVTAFIPI